MARQTVLITGGAGGIGSALARILVGRGDSVVLFGRRPEPLEQFANELGESALAVVGDARSEEDLSRAVERGQTHFGRLDGLAHCIGSIVLKPLHLVSRKEFTETIEQNLTSAFLAARAVLGPFRGQNSGSIVLVSTVAVGQGMSNHDLISSVKAGIEGLVRASAMTYARQNIRFNAVAPGLTLTPLAEPIVRSETNRSFSESLHPLGRLGQPEEIARPIAYLLSPEASWITGQVWGIDGGLGAGIAPPRQVARV